MIGSLVKVIKSKKENCYWTLSRTVRIALDLYCLIKAYRNIF